MDATKKMTVPRSQVDWLGLSSSSPRDCRLFPMLMEMEPTQPSAMPRPFSPYPTDDVECGTLMHSVVLCAIVNAAVGSLEANHILSALSLHASSFTKGVFTKTVHEFPRLNTEPRHTVITGTTSTAVSCASFTRAAHGVHRPRPTDRAGALLWRMSRLGVRTNACSVLTRRGAHTSPLTRSAIERSASGGARWASRRP